MIKSSIIQCLMGDQVIPSDASLSSSDIAGLRFWQHNSFPFKIPILPLALTRSDKFAVVITLYHHGLCGFRGVEGR